MKIGLFGFTFDHENMGCQALTCAFLNELQNIIKDEEIEIVDFHRDSSLGLIPELFPNMKFKICHVRIKDISVTYLKEVKSCDIVFDETYGDGFSDIYFGNDVYLSVLVKLLCASTKTPYIFTPQTYGPFKRKPLEWLAGKAIKKADYVFARDKVSSDYAEKISGRKVITVTDLAFALPYHVDKPKNGNRVGINISGLLWNGGFNNNTNQFHLIADYKEYCRRLIMHLLENGYEVHLIPHVTKSSDEGKVLQDGDYPACLDLHKLFPDTILAPCFEDPYSAKNYIAQMDFFIGARMHSTIGAFSANVITIPFAYSRKFRGLYENLDYSFYVDGTVQGTDECLERTLRWIRESDLLKEKQQVALLSIEQKMNTFRNNLKIIIK